MVNRIKGEAKFSLEGKEYTLCFDNAALINLEDMLDKGIVAISSEMAKWKEEPDRIRLKWIRAMLWAGLHRHHPDLTLDQVGDLISNSDAGTVLNSIGDAIQKSFGVAEDGTKEARPTNGDGRTGTGSESSVSTSPQDSNSKVSGNSLPAN